MRYIKYNVIQDGFSDLTNMQILTIVTLINIY